MSVDPAHQNVTIHAVWHSGHMKTQNSDTLVHPLFFPSSNLVYYHEMQADLGQFIQGFGLL